MIAPEVVSRWRSRVGWPAGWVLLSADVFRALWGEVSGDVLPVSTAAVVLHVAPDRIRAWVRRGEVRGFAFPARHNWVALADVRALCSSSEP